MNVRTPTNLGERTPFWLEAENLDAIPRGRESLALASLRKRLLEEAMEEPTDTELNNLLRLAAAEAEAQAWLTPFPLLVLPELLEEKLEAVRTYARKRAWLRRRFDQGLLPAGYGRAQPR